MDYQSTVVLLPLQIIRLNRAPVISNLFAPDTVSISQRSFTISVKVIDPDGQGDIKSVLRFTPSGKILHLYAYNDSIYAETVSLDPPPKLDSYLFHFLAVDQSNDTSNVLPKIIVVTN